MTCALWLLMILGMVVWAIGAWGWLEEVGFLRGDRRPGPPDR
jgi:hypothetical protein